jgi:hypothetical protein
LQVKASSLDLQMPTRGRVAPRLGRAPPQLGRQIAVYLSFILHIISFFLDVALRFSCPCFFAP